jgi:hypothetical protein
MAAALMRDFDIRPWTSAAAAMLVASIREPIWPSPPRHWKRKKRPKPRRPRHLFRGVIHAPWVPLQIPA